MDPSKRKGLTEAELARHSVHLPKDSLLTSIAMSSRYFLDDRDTHYMAHSIKHWLSDDEWQAPTTTAMPSTIASLKFPERAAARSSARDSERNRQIRTSMMLGIIPYGAVRPGEPPSAKTRSLDDVARSGMISSGDVMRHRLV
ncbi:hypothetical protein JDV02_003446 [Purpureocillium takamizusanense]|uniref:Uncharacterized protein n=1 Tax=Purpureocillium takamizusanense TaxID=2060973 RepID=A0A9Q8QD48_9HYPO|nr:uncharacterized protein JDV02_003446 [Purpureocillium takamizusanense]UNI17067.1 hypothetical protein JDV02_003446 [Purpureocillium takamizusanense]